MNVIFSGAVASMFWVDAALGVDIYLDGKFGNEIFYHLPSKMLMLWLRSLLLIHIILLIGTFIGTLFKLVLFDDEVKSLFIQILSGMI